MILVNGKFTEHISASDRGFLYGDGLFETIEVRRGIPVFLSRHLERLKQGCARLGLVMPDAELLSNELCQLYEQHDEGILKIVITRGNGGRGYRPPEDAETLRVLSFHSLPEIPDYYYTQGIRLYACETDVSVSKTLSGLKSLCRLDQVMAQREWNEGEYAEGLMCDASGHVIEGTKSNLFVVSEGELFTPALQYGGVKGIMRDKILELAQQCGIPVHEKTMYVDFVKQADEIFMTNSIIHIWPVCQYAENIYEVGAITLQLMSTLKQDLMNE